MNDPDKATASELGSTKQKTRVRKTWLLWLRRWIVRTFGIGLMSVLCFLVAAWVLGNTPINRSFQHAGTIDGIDILVINNGVHADLVIPIDEPAFRWSDHFRSDDFRSFDPRYRYAVFGWGNRQFYMETETWDDLEISNVLFAFAGLGDTVVHVDLAGDLNWFSKGSRKIRLSPEQFKRLSQYLLSSFKTQSNGALIPIPDRHYRETDAFYEGTGHYNLFRTCNVWAGGGLAKAGVRVGYWTLTPGLLFACLPESAPEE